MGFVGSVAFYSKSSTNFETAAEISRKFNAEAWRIVCIVFVYIRISAIKQSVALDYGFSNWSRTLQTSGSLPLSYISFKTYLILVHMSFHGSAIV